MPCADIPICHSSWFCCCCWWGAFSQDAILTFAFDLYDIDSSGCIDVGEVQTMLKEVVSCLVLAVLSCLGCFVLSCLVLSSCAIGSASFAVLFLLNHECTVPWLLDDSWTVIFLSLRSLEEAGRHTHCRWKCTRNWKPSEKSMEAISNLQSSKVIPTFP